MVRLHPWPRQAVKQDGMILLHKRKEALVFPEGISECLLRKFL